MITREPMYYLYDSTTKKDIDKTDSNGYSFMRAQVIQMNEEEGFERYKIQKIIQIKKTIFS